MSQVATFFTLERERVPALVAATRPKRRLLRREPSRFPEAWAEATTELGDEPLAGTPFVVLLPFLDEHGASPDEPALDDAAAAFTEALDAATFLFSPARADALDRLPAGDEALRAFHRDLLAEEPSAEDLQAARDALGALRRHLAGTGDAAVLGLTVA